MGAKRFITSAGKGVSLPFRQIGVAANLALREPPQFAGRAQEARHVVGPARVEQVAFRVADRRRQLQAAQKYRILK
jgi:hypothetical protein